MNANRCLTATNGQIRMNPVLRRVQTVSARLMACSPRQYAHMSIAAAFIVLVFSYSLISRKLASTLITAPILFTAAGALMLLFPEASRELSLDRKALLLIAEVGLVMTLFTDASHISRRALQDNHKLPARLLSVGDAVHHPARAVAAMACFTGLCGGRPASWRRSSRRPTPAGRSSSTARRYRRAYARH